MSLTAVKTFATESAAAALDEAASDGVSGRITFATVFAEAAFGTVAGAAPAIVSGAPGLGAAASAIFHAQHMTSQASVEMSLTLLCGWFVIMERVFQDMNVRWDNPLHRLW